LLLFLLLFGGSANASLPVVLVIGDSLSAAYGMPVEKGWVSLIKKRMQSRARIENESESAKTTPQVTHKLPDWLKKHQPQVVILEIGANDGLRGHPPSVIYTNLAGMIERSLQAGAAVLLTGIDIPANYGPAYRDAFRSVYTKLAADYDIAFIPSMFDEIFSRPELLQADGLHPNETAQHLIADRIYPVLRTLLD